MAEVFAGSDAVADELLEFLDVRESAGGCARPEKHSVRANVKDPAGSGDEGELADVILERGEQFLGHPGSPEEPTALGAVFDFDARTLRCHRRASVALLARRLCSLGSRIRSCCFVLGVRRHGPSFVRRMVLTFGPWWLGFWWGSRISAGSWLGFG